MHIESTGLVWDWTAAVAVVPTCGCKGLPRLDLQEGKVE